MSRIVVTDQSDLNEAIVSGIRSVAVHTTKDVHLSNAPAGTVFHLYDETVLNVVGPALVVAHDETTVVGRGPVTVIARDNSTVVVTSDATVRAFDHSFVDAEQDCWISAQGNVNIEARDRAEVVASGQATVVAHDQSRVHEWPGHPTRVTLMDDSRRTLRGTVSKPSPS